MNQLSHWLFKISLISIMWVSTCFAQGRPESEILKSYGFDRLKHYTRINNLLGILKSGRMQLGMPGYTPNQVMFYALPDKVDLSKTVGRDLHFFSTEYHIKREVIGGVTVREVMDTTFGMVQLVFDISALDHRKFHISPGAFNGDGSGYGRVVPGESFQFGEDLADWLEKRKAKTPGQLGELGVFEAVPVAGFLKEIWVADPVKKYLIEALKSAGQHTLDGRPIEDFIKSESFDGSFDSIEFVGPNHPLQSHWRIKFPMKISAEEYAELMRRENTLLRKTTRALKRILGACDRLLVGQ